MTKIVPPTTCPSCDSQLELVKDQLFCRNKNCEAQTTKRLQAYCKKLKIKGFGEKTLEKLELVSISELYELTHDCFIDCGFSTKMASKLLGEVDSAREVSLSDFLSAVSIPLIGDSAARKIATLAGTPDDLLNIPAIDISKLLGESRSKNLVSWLNNEWAGNELPVTFVKDIRGLQESKGTVCLTGKILGFTKATATEALQAVGFTVVPSVTKTTNYLATESGDDSGSSSCKKANKFGVPIVALTDLLEE